MHLSESSWLKKFAGRHEVTPFGSVLFPGGVPPRAEELGGLAAAGLTAEKLPDSSDTHWALRLTHPAWGMADAFCLREPPLPPREIVDVCLNLTNDEKDAIHGARSAVIVRLKDKTPNALGDRKRFLRFARIVMDQYGVAVADHLSWLFWSRAALDEELTHDADLDISALYVLHAVQGDQRRVNWLHSHGLGEIGFFDFDIVAPSEAVHGVASDVLRGIAFAILEGKVQSSTPSFLLAQPDGVVAFVEANQFAHRAPAEALALWDADEEHRRNHSVLCEPRAGLLNRWFRGVEPSKFLSVANPVGRLVMFSNAATELMAARARGTYQVFRSLFDEFQDLQLPYMVKLGYRNDGGDEDDREHLWFTVHELRDESIEATLENEPFGIERMHQGDRGNHSLDLLTEWVVQTPAGFITPHSMIAAREVRRNKDEIRKLMLSPRQSR